VDRTLGRRTSKVPLVAAAWTCVFVIASLGTFLIARGEDAQREACEGSWGSRETNECDERSDAAPVVSYSGILFPERGVFLFFGIPCAPLWFVTILLSHRALQQLADLAWQERGYHVDTAGGTVANGNAAGSLNEAPMNDDNSSFTPRPVIPHLRKMEPLSLIATPLLLLVVCVSLGDPDPGPAIHAMAAFFFFLFGVYNVYLTQAAMGAIVGYGSSDASTPGMGVSSRDGMSSHNNYTLSQLFKKGMQWKRNVLFGLFGLMVPVTVAWGFLAYRLDEGDQMLAPVQYLWILSMILGNGACFVEILEAERVGENNQSEAVSVDDRHSVMV